MVPRTIIGLTVALLLLGGCSLLAPEPAPLPPFEESGPASAPTPTAVAPANPPPLVEEVIEPREEAAPPEEGAAQALPDSKGAPSVLSTLSASTPPNVAAATRLAEQARIRLAAGEPENAIEPLERAIAIDPTNVYAYYFLGETYLARGSLDQAVAFAERAAQLGARTDPSWTSRSYALAGRIFETAGRFGDARQAYAQALQADEGNEFAAQGLNRLGGGYVP